MQWWQVVGIAIASFLAGFYIGSEVTTRLFKTAARWMRGKGA
jgi:hypothetical protein